MAVSNRKTYYQKIYDSMLSDIKDGKYNGGKRLPTEKELADEFGVSIITSRTALKLLAENGYITRIPGKGSFVTGKVTDEDPEMGHEGVNDEKPLQIGLLLTDFDENYATGLLSSISRELDRRDIMMCFARSYESQDREEEALAKLIEQGAEGFIIMPVHGKHYNLQILRLVLDKVPIVIIDRQLKGINASFVGSNNAEASKKATNYLIELGHNKIAFLSPPVEDTTTLEDRLDGFFKAHMEHGMNADLSIVLKDIISTTPGNKNDDTVRTDVEKIQKLLIDNPQITCLYAAEYCIALIAMKAIQSIGKSVPEDISVLCFDGPPNTLGEYFFTHVRQNEEEIGALAVDLLLRQFNDIEEKQHVYLETNLVIGKSTRSIL